jgi:1-acyl-sn-glycerol-3-phosphate acyltransferase
MILVSRRWTNDARLIERAFARVKRNEHGVWIVLYPEGTRKTPNKLLEVSRMFLSPRSGSIYAL